jgi:hypothetical protein
VTLPLLSELMRAQRFAAPPFPAEAMPEERTGIALPLAAVQAAVDHLTDAEIAGPPYHLWNALGNAVERRRSACWLVVGATRRPSVATVGRPATASLMHPHT